MKLISKILRKKNQAGDTIVEVMISLTMLSLALGSAYALSNQSLRNATEANQRSEALALAQSQVDLLASERNNDSTFAADYQVGSPFCINMDSTKINADDDGFCDDFNSTSYNIAVNYGSSNQVFTVTAQWDNPTQPGGVATLNLYYKLPGSY